MRASEIRALSDNELAGKEIDIRITHLSGWTLIGETESAATTIKKEK